MPGPCPRPQTPSVPVPNLPRIRSRRAAPGRPVADTRPRITELQSDGIIWVHLLAPTTEEAQGLASRFGWHPLDVEDVLSRRQRPKVDVYPGADEGRGGYLFSVLHFPVYDKAVGRLNAGELDVFVGPDYIVTLPAVELRPVTLLFRRAHESEELRHQLLSRGTGRLLYELLDDLYDYCFPILDKIGFKLEQIDEEIGAAEGAKGLVTDIHKVKQEIISYRKIIKPQRPTLRQLERSIERFLPEDLELYFDDIVDASERIWDLLDNYKEVVEALEDTNESLISHQQNDILYVLTVFIVVLTPLSFITGFFGMNVHFPGYNTRDAFFAALGLMAVTVVGMLGFFRWKRWL
jgi:magnesium transporter